MDVVAKKRGRKKGSSSSFYIKDKMIYPFYIKQEGITFSVHKEADEGGVDTFIGHFNSLETAFKILAKYKFYEENKKDYDSFREYLNEWKSYLNRLESIIK